MSDKPNLYPEVGALAPADGGYRLLFEANPAPMWVFDRETFRFLAVNEAAVEHYGYSRDEFLKMTLHDIRSKADHAALAEAVAANVGFLGGRVWEHVAKDGRRFSVEVKARNVTFEGRAARLAALKDVTAQLEAIRLQQELNEELERRVEERTAELRAANDELESFCFSVSHDFRTPLRAIDGFSRAVQEDLDDRLDDVGRDYLRRIRAASQKLSHLMDGMLLLSRLTRSDLAPEELDLSRMAAAAAQDLRIAEPEREVEISIQPGMRATGDLRLVRLLLECLVGNAWKFTRDVSGARIEIAADAAEPSVFYVRDNGAGFDMEYLNKLFHPFERLHRDTEFPGLGLGLATSRRIVARHGGNISIEGAVGQGARVSFTLGPRAKS